MLSLCLLFPFGPKNQLKVIYHLTSEMVFSPVKTYNSILGFLTYLRQFIGFALNPRNSFKVKLFPCLDDRYDSAGSFPLHYFHQDLWAARKVFEINPEHHVDIGSRIDKAAVSYPVRLRRGS